MKRTITIATRESPLALWQANWVKARLEAIHAEITVNLLGLTTTADQLDIPLTVVGGKGLFVKELEEALLDGRADIAVHSMKDVPMELPNGLIIPVLCDREAPQDVFVSEAESLSSLPMNAVVGTSSLRQQSQVLAMRPDLQIKPLRGNVNTRLAKLDRGDYAALILAAAGLKRLGFENRIREFLSVDDMLPAPGQGVLGIECREKDEKILSLIKPLNHKKSADCVTAERSLCARLNGGCQAPVAAYAEIKDEKIFLRGLVAKPDGTLVLRGAQSDWIENAVSLGIKVADDLLSQGAGEILSCLMLKK